MLDGTIENFSSFMDVHSAVLKEVQMISGSILPFLIPPAVF